MTTNMRADHRNERRFGPRSPGVLCAFMLAGLVMLSADSTQASGRTFTVTTVDDEVDSAPGDGTCDTGTELPAVDCTLRAAMQEAEANVGHDVIEFAIPGAGPHTIQPVTGVSTTSSSPGPETGYDLINDPAGLTIDGYSQPGAVENTAVVGTNAQIMIELQGLGPDGIDGIDFRSSFNVIRGIAIFDYKRHLRFFGAAAHSNEVTGNFIGSDSTPDPSEAPLAREPSSNGVHISQGAHANRIGRSNREPEIDARHRNLIAGLADKGVSLRDSGTVDNIIQNNMIGLDPTGLLRVANQGHGVDINVGASGNWVGGFGPGEGNVLSGNGLSGVEISHNSASGGITGGNLIVNNLIGTTADGTAGPVELRNIEQGINFEGNEVCVVTCPPDISGNSAIGNVVVGSPVNIIIWKGATDTSIIANTIGLLADGSTPVSSALTSEAVSIRVGAFDNLIELNTIGGVQRGIHVRPTSPTSGDGVFATFGNTFTRNSIVDISLGLGIALYGPDEDLPGQFDQGPLEPHPDSNADIVLPTISAVSSDGLTGTGCADCIVEVYVTPTRTCMFCFSSYGEGERFVALGTTDAVGDVLITFRTVITDPIVVEAGDRVTMLVTDADGNTSEFSERVTAAAGLIGPPPPPPPTTTPSTTTTIPLPTTTTPTTTTTTTTTTALPANPIGSGADATEPAERCALTTTC